jgi:hypothetical protein
MRTTEPDKESGKPSDREIDGRQQWKELVRARKQD